MSSDINRLSRIASSLAPSWVPAGALAFYDFVNDRAYSARSEKTSTADLTTVRASAGYDLAATTLFAANVARRTSAGLLVEPAATNQLFSSAPPVTMAAFTSSARWYLDGGTWTGNNATGPDGTLTAGSATLPTNTGGVFYQFPATLAASTATYYIKGSAGTQIYVYWDGGNTAPFNRLLVTFTGGWDRILIPQFAARYLGLSTKPKVSGDVALPAVNYQVWQANVETAATWTSLIPTTTAPVTRPADAISLTLPAGTNSIVYTFDDNSTQTITATAGTYNLPTTLNRPLIKSLSVMQ